MKTAVILQSLMPMWRSALMECTRVKRDGLEKRVTFRSVRDRWEFTIRTNWLQLTSSARVMANALKPDASVNKTGVEQTVRFTIKRVAKGRWCKTSLSQTANATNRQQEATNAQWSSATMTVQDRDNAKRMGAVSAMRVTRVRTAVFWRSILRGSDELGDCSGYWDGKW